MTQNSDNNKNPDLENSKIEYLTKLAHEQLQLEYKIFSSSDTKAIWLISFLVTGLSLIIVNFSQLFTDLLIVSIIFGLSALGTTLCIIYPREFFIGSGAKKITKEFWPSNKTLNELEQDILSNLNHSTEQNKATIRKKNLCFKVAFYLTIIFLLTFILFLFLNYEIIQ